MAKANIFRESGIENPKRLAVGAGVFSMLGSEYRTFARVHKTWAVREPRAAHRRSPRGEG
jgi:hypothetical protein